MAVDEQARILQHRAESYLALSKTDGFRELMGELSRKADRIKRETTERVMGGGPVDQRQVDYDRGFHDALRYIPQVIQGAERKLRQIDAEVEAPEPERGSDW